MNKFLALTKIQLKDFFSKYTQQINIKNKSLSKIVGILPIFAFVPIAIMIKMTYDSFSVMGMPELTMTFAYVIATMFSFITAIPLVISVYFYAKDLALIATLPVKKNSIVFSKLASIYVYLAVVSLSIFGLSAVFYSFTNGINPMALFLGIVISLLLPIMPMIFAVLTILPFMSLIGGKKRRNLFVILGNILLLVVIIGMQTLFTRLESDPAALAEILLQDNGIMKLVGSKFPPSVWATQAVLGSWGPFLLFLGLNILVLLALRLASSFLYKTALEKYNQVATSDSKGKLNYSSHSKRILLIKRHLGIIFSNPTFMLNTVLIMLLPVIMGGIYLATGNLNLEMLKDPRFLPFMPYIFAGIIITPSFVGNLSATVITREGKTFWETRVLPISIEENLRARIDSTLLISFTASILLGIGGVILLPLTFLDIFMGIILCISATLCFSTMDLIINIQRPLLNWSNPTAAVKNNLNIMLSFLTRAIIGGGMYGIYRLLPNTKGTTLMMLFAVLLIILFGISHVLVYGIFKKKFIEIDV